MNITRYGFGHRLQLINNELGALRIPDIVALPDGAYVQHADHVAITNEMQAELVEVERIVVAQTVTITELRAAAVASQVRDWTKIQAHIKDYVDDYEMIGEDDKGRDGCHTPTDGERALITDAIHGLLGESEFDALYHPQPPTSAQALPTENMVIAGFEAVSLFQHTDAYKEMSGCQGAAESARICWAAMVAYMPKSETPRQDLPPSEAAIQGIWAEESFARYGAEAASGFARTLLARYGKSHIAAQPSVPDGWAVKRVGDAIHIEQLGGKWCGYMLASRGGPAHDLTYNFLNAMLKAAPTPQADGQAQQDLSVWVRRLAHELNDVAPSNGLHKEAMNYLDRKGLRKSSLHPAQQDADKVDAQPVGYFQNVNSMNGLPPQYEQVAAVAKSEDDVFPLYRAPVAAQPDPAMAGG